MSHRVAVHSRHCDYFAVPGPCVAFFFGRRSFHNRHRLRSSSDSPDRAERPLERFPATPRFDGIRRSRPVGAFGCIHPLCIVSFALIRHRGFHRRDGFDPFLSSRQRRLPHPISGTCTGFRFDHPAIAAESRRQQPVQDATRRARFSLPFGFPAGNVISLGNFEMHARSRT